ncbi:MAG: alpha amylase C-terminal domain-containing protein [Akkermansiaceae bacterium]|nr:alpha amylase C-terminal domain-containing protein [Akkermansiaceae bacterium]
MSKSADDAPGLVKIDPWLEPYSAAIHQRTARYQQKLQEYGPLSEFATSHKDLGLHRNGNEWVFREWAPRAKGLFLTGDFCGWSREAHPLRRSREIGVWEVRLPGAALKDGDLYKVHIVGANGAHDRMPSHASFLVQDEVSKAFSAQVVDQPDFQWQYDPPGEVKAPRIYEAHVGMATEEYRVGTYREFADEILPRIARLGYNVVQIMAIAEHPYYGSFGYHVANYFAPSSRCGTPDDLKDLIDKAHGLGLAVLMDIVHSHSVKNFAEGLAAFDGEEGLYFHEREHPQWDSRLFDYSRREVCRFLLSNVAYWMTEFRFDGFRFDGVTSMLYHHHGNITFDNYDKYFLDGVEWDAVTYLQLANHLIHEINPNALSIAEDMSGMPGLCRPLSEGGMGFDYRLAMGIPDHWIKLLKHTPDEHWNLDEICQTLTNRRYGEKTIAYAESHDQALVGDKTLAFRLMDSAMYHHMAREDDHTGVARGMALHKILRLITLALGGEGYLTFMGNEFGHPEWVDFPREGNGWSYQYARRQWSLANNPKLKYGQLEAFDTAMMEIAKVVLGTPAAKMLSQDQANQCFQFERGNLIFAVNLSPSISVADYGFPVPAEGEYRLILSSDDPQFGGHGRADAGIAYPSVDGRLKIYLPSRTVLVFRAE